MLNKFRAWRRNAGVRGFGPGISQPTGWYIKFTPNFGLSIKWLKGRRLRYALHHGLQRVAWNPGGRWVVEKQLLGNSKVKGEVHGTVR